MNKKEIQKSKLNRSLFPSIEVLNRLAISENGFLFDPSSSNSFTLNQTGSAVIDILKKELDADQTIKLLLQEFDVTASTVERDLFEFARTLREWLGTT
ncbi:MAG: PqqD family protein [Gammaproteobacteria bacterium]|nr:PqqD family protein [Gammaproteobacteria bacterium]